MHIYLFVDLSSSAPAETSGYIMNRMVTDKSLLFSLCERAKFIPT